MFVSEGIDNFCGFAMHPKAVFGVMIHLGEIKQLHCIRFV